MPDLPWLEIHSPSNPRAVPQTLLQNWQDDGVIEWWGRRTDMPEVFRQAHVVCLPSTYGEGVPKVLLEAAACGRAIVATDIPGCREIVKDGENGLLVPAGNVDALCDALQCLLQDAEKRRQFGLRGRKFAELEFSETDVARQTLAVYQEVLER